MATEFEIRAGERAAMQAAPGMGGFSARAIAKAVIEAVDRVRGASTITSVCKNENCPTGGAPVEIVAPPRVGS